jgi:hypothetical protein
MLELSNCYVLFDNPHQFDYYHVILVLKKWNQKMNTNVNSVLIRVIWIAIYQIMRKYIVNQIH